MIREDEQVYAIVVSHNKTFPHASGQGETIHAWDGVCGDCIDSLMDEWVSRRRSLRAE
ncbi:hypothetical protein TPY_2764 [Sulfobacillus acidophilus TPY]|nr:hypothetical protein TPY_2764 [Sulfobacillus acidophilus TPY]